ncbi:hypothetical protein C0J52_23451 [Blattella germanica]|nr:hypothetical protein C0J52_23451 [Blattella germanica]
MKPSCEITSILRITTQQIYAMVRRMTILSDYKKKVIGRKCVLAYVYLVATVILLKWCLMPNTQSCPTAEYCSFKTRPVPMCHSV